MESFLISLILGMIPDVTFLSFFIIYAKKLQNKKRTFFVLLLIDYIVTLIICRYQTAFYIAFIVLEFIILKLLYKESVEFIDTFVLVVPFALLFLMSCICYFLIPNYIVACIINKISILLIVFFSRNRLNDIYKMYKHFWNRNKEEIRKIKSITLRNISIILMYLFIFISNIACIYITNVR